MEDHTTDSPRRSPLETAVAGRVYPDISRLDWLESLLFDWKALTWEDRTDAEKIRSAELFGLLDDLRRLTNPRRSHNRLRTALFCLAGSWVAVSAAIVLAHALGI